MFGDRPFAPTAGKRERARQENQVPRGRDFSPVCVLLAAVLLMTWIGPTITLQLKQMMKQSLSSVQLDGASQLGTDMLSGTALVTMARVGLPVMGVCLLVAVLSQVAQVGLSWKPSQARPMLQRVDPLQGARHLVMPDRWLEAGHSLVRLFVAFSVVGASLWYGKQQLVVERFESLNVVTDRSFGIVTTALWSLAIVAIAEYGLRWWIHEQRLRMTVEEMRDEMEGRGGMAVASLRDGMHSQSTKRPGKPDFVEEHEPPLDPSLDADLR